MTSKIASAIFAKVKDLKSFTSKDVGPLFPAVPYSILKGSLEELVDSKQVFRYGVKRGTFYSSNPNLQEEIEETREVSDSLMEVVETFALSKDTFKSSDVFQQFPNTPEHIIRQILVILRDEKEVLWLHGHGVSSVWSKHKELPDDPELDIPEEKSEDETLKTLILNYAKKANRWFRRTEIDELCDNSPYEIRRALQSLMDSGDIAQRGEKRGAEYAYYEVIDESETIDSESETKVDQELKHKILEFIKESGVVVVPQLVAKFERPRTVIIFALKELEEEEEIYHEGIKKSSRYVHKDYTEPVKATDDTEDKQQSIIKEKAIDKLSDLLQSHSPVYIHFSSVSNKYEIRAFNQHLGNSEIIKSNEDPKIIIQDLLDMTRIVA